MKRPVPIEDRFWQQVAEDDSGCWNWTGYTREDGYGQIKYGRADNYVRFYVHRWAYEYVVAKIPDGLTIDHRCRNHACVNPAHLEVVTDRENILRGNGPAALNARKTTCKHGHPLSGANLMRVGPRHSWRRCRVCHVEQVRRSRAAA